MKASHIHLAIICCGFLLLGCSNNSDEARMQGKWLEAEAHIYGKPSERVSAAYTFADGQLIMHYRNSQLPDRLYRYEINEQTGPPRLDVLFRYDEADDWSRYKGIYKLDGDTMIWCQSLTGHHPEDFEPGGIEELRIVIRLERVK